LKLPGGVGNQGRNGSRNRGTESGPRANVVGPRRPIGGRVVAPWLIHTALGRTLICASETRKARKAAGLRVVGRARRASRVDARDAGSVAPPGPRRVDEKTGWSTGLGGSRRCRSRTADAVLDTRPAGAQPAGARRAGERARIAGLATVGRGLRAVRGRAIPGRLGSLGPANGGARRPWPCRHRAGGRAGGLGGPTRGPSHHQKRTRQTKREKKRNGMGIPRGPRIIYSQLSGLNSVPPPPNGRELLFRG